MDRNNLDAIVVFLRVAELGSFSAAANNLHVSPSAVSQSISQLESRTKMRLLHRTTRSLSLTEAGERLFQRVEPAMEAVSDAMNEVSSWADTPSGTLRINMPRYAATVLVQHLYEGFLTRYPEINLDICIDNGLSDIVAGGFDAGIRLGTALEDNVVAVPLTRRLTSAIAAAPVYLKRKGRPESPEALAGHDCICFRRGTTGTAERWDLGSGGQSCHAAGPSEGQRQRHLRAAARRALRGRRRSTPDRVREALYRQR